MTDRRSRSTVPLTIRATVPALVIHCLVDDDVPRRLEALHRDNAPREAQLTVLSEERLFF